MTRAILLVVLPLAACVNQDVDLKIWQAEQARVQRDMLETERLRLWLDHPGYVSRGRR
jgi:hypothetical protein